VDVAAGITSVQNVATVDSDLNGNLLVTDPGEQQVASASARWTALASTANSITLPKTGFAPNVVTDLRNVPHEAYLDTNGVTVEIPSLGVSILVVGVPKKNGTWNVSWLGNQAGWLEGTAFPSWSGNSVLTGHVYNSNGRPGPFVNLNKLKYGDQIIVHAYGQNYIFEVRSNEVVEPNDKSVLKHEEKPWLTVVTCKEYDQKTNTYKKRVVIRAVLVKVTKD
jgi:LPXTG-site transpeptidase (sortase) family protein